MNVTLRDWVQLFRIHQWSKNLFVLAAILFSGRLFDSSLWVLVALGFASFSLIASATYCFNDASDAAKDALHPLKANRPVARGAISIKTANLLGIVLTVLALSLAYLINEYALLLILLYFILNLCYTFWLKKMVLLDVFCIASGFILRVLVGSWAIGIIASQWLLLCTFNLSLFLGFAKRYAELDSLSSDNFVESFPPDKKPPQKQELQRDVLAEYSLPFLRVLLAVSLAMTITTYGLYTTSSRTLAVHHSEAFVYTVPLVIFGLFRYLHLVFRKGKGQDTAWDLVGDPQIILCITGFIALSAFILIH